MQEGCKEGCEGGGPPQPPCQSESIKQHISRRRFQCEPNFQAAFVEIRGPEIPKRSPPNVPYENCSHFCDLFRFSGGRFFRFGGSNNIFNLCPNIELNTQNPNPILIISICFTKNTKMPKSFRNFGNCSKIENVQSFILYYV